MVRDQLARLEDRDFHLSVAWALEDGETPPETGIAGFRQRGRDLGARLWHGLGRAARRAERVAAVGSDHPGLDLKVVRDAFARLAAGADVVLGPAADGGYYLLAIASRKLDRELFSGVSWSTGTVLAETLERCRRLALRRELLPEAEDVDTPEDLERLAARLARGDDGCPRTRRLLESWGRLGR